VVTPLNDYPFMLPLIVAIIGTVLGFYYFNRTNKTDREALARQKKKDEIELAKELRQENEKLAKDVKSSMTIQFSILLDKMKTDIELQKSILTAEINLMKRDDKDLRKDLEDAMKQQQTINDRIQKSIDFMSQFLWGVGAKSDPAYITGQIETKEHEDKPSVGIFKSPDSSETQAHKDEN
jgi:hypothetical protein